MRIPTFAELRTDSDSVADLLGIDLSFVFDAIEAAGITDDDMPDDLPDDALMEWPNDETAQLAWWRKYFPVVMTKLEGN